MTWHTDDEPMYDDDLMPEPDTDTWMAEQADAAWQTLPVWRRVLLMARSRRYAWRMRQRWRRTHRRMHPGIPASECPDPNHGEEPPF